MVAMQEQTEVEVVIVGAGPAGLAAAHACLSRGVSFSIVEGGPVVEQRSLDDPGSVVHGVGGAGLYSDGKLSYFPAAHALWALPSTNILHRAFSWLHTLIADFVETPPEFPDLTFSDEWYQPTQSQTFVQKQYPAIVLSDKQRELLLRRLVGSIEHRILSGFSVVAVARDPTGFSVQLRETSGRKRQQRIRAQQIIYCGGRFGAIDFLKLFPHVPSGFVRFEYGIRIEQRAHQFCIKAFESNDTKLILASEDRTCEWRTFCECREGRVVLCQHGDIRAYSGLSGDGSTGANTGFMTRIMSADAYKECKAEAERILEGHVKTEKLHFSDFVRRLSTGDVFGPLLDGRLKNGLDKFASQFEIGDATVYSPCIEGTGFYPWTTAHLETAIPGVYLAGDCVGRFRGLLPAFLSGFYVGERASLGQFESEEELRAGFHIERSSISSIPMIFTAQSKTVFYCRDVICEFVLKRGGLPLNPFRVFGYFLSDRVDRATVRRGNNQLVKACDEIWVFGPVADGVLFEVVYALNIGKPIRFFTVGTRVEDIREIMELSKVSFEREVHAPGTTRESLLKSIEMAFERRHAFRNQGDLPL